MRVIKGLIPMMGLFVFFGAVFPIMGGGTDSEAQSQFEKPHLWDDDVLVADGPVQNGISIDHDTSGNLYAVRCSTYNGVDNAFVGIYKSTDGGANWFYLTSWWSSMGNSCSYPVILTGSWGNKLYFFDLYSYRNGDLYVDRYTQSGTWEHWAFIETTPSSEGWDTITYFSACSDYGLGNYLMVAYQKEEKGDATPDLYTIVSTDQGETWHNNVKITEDGAHPDIAYGINGNVYLVYESTGGGDREIWFARSNNYCASGSWEYFEALTSDSWDDTYPKIAALHTSPDSTPYVWVAYNHDFLNSGNIDLRYAYSTNGGASWSKNHNLATLSDYDEMAPHLWVRRSTSNTTVNICYLKYKWQMIPYSYIFYAYVGSSDPDNWSTPTQIGDHRAADLPDSRKVCQGSFTGAEQCMLYAGRSLENLYFDNIAWTDVEEKGAEEELPAQFSLSPNYPNPFNPETRIQYTVGTQKAVHGSQFMVRSPVHTTLKIYNVLGQLVKTLVNEPKEPGTYEVIWDGKDKNGEEVASGIYFYKLQAGDFTEAKKMLLLK